MADKIQDVMGLLEKAKRLSSRRVEFWSARDIQSALAYGEWRNFESVIQKAMAACKGAGVNPANHFVETAKMVGIGSDATRSQKDYLLTRYACYLVAMNGDATKPEIGAAQTYFAVQTRRMELRDQQDLIEERLKMRNRLKEANKQLSGAAKNAGVTNRGFPLFHDAGYRGLYGMSRAEILAHKNLPHNEELLDRAGHTELAANYFRATQTWDKLEREKIRGENIAIKTHFTVGKQVRDTIKEIGGTMPENLPPEPSIKKLASVRRRQLKTAQKPKLPSTGP